MTPSDKQLEPSLECSKVHPQALDWINFHTVTVATLQGREDVQAAEMGLFLRATLSNVAPSGRTSVIKCTACKEKNKH